MTSPSARALHVAPDRTPQHGPSAFAEGDTVVAHVSMRGKHTGELMGMPPSGKDVTMRVSDLVRMENGKAVERWGVEDMSGLSGQA